MPTRNTAVLTRIVESLGDLVSSPSDALARLEQEFNDSLLLVAGNVNDVARHAEKLRLAITADEAPQVLNYIARTEVVGITIDHVEDAINSTFGEDRFIEP
jgi:hypothetical protein